MKISAVAVVLAAVAGISAAPMPNGQVSPTPLSTISHPCREPVEALEARASDAISSFMSFFRRDDGIVTKSELVGPRKKVTVRTVGRTFSFPR
ncbi:hypothetical protein INS49_005827 [Diaporthe citri]|uniref:uncharacterized protein n=1 Tax=Diaporthe citri TaxID=83186 RepID=UPI001C81B33A|nr:uncharacterized protein INS49_005827 [Diaporthe citri]KAG6364229.1 hypothetical protein INS49_005827 [Diaporthe citri]